MAHSSLHPPVDRDTAEIRLLELLPGQKNDEISCNSFVVSVSEAPAYEALSYVWGDKNETFDILLCGKKFPALKSLQVCLTELRYQDRSRIMWIDSVCIDQNDHAERSHQVRLMAQIYRKATKVIAWISDPHNLSVETTKLIVQLKEIETLITHYQGGSLSSTLRAARNALFREKILEFRSFLMCSWWSRVWTLQEMLLAQDLEFRWCGSTGLNGLSWGDFKIVVESHKDVIEALDWNENLGLAGMSDLLGTLSKICVFHMAQNTYQAGKLHMFVDLALLAHERKCTNPRDRIYGLLGLAADLSELIVDYNAPLAQVYERTIIESIRTTESLDILLNRRSFPSTHGMPSWVTDWEKEDFKVREVREAEFTLNAYQGTLYSTGSFAPAQIANDRGRLVCAGRLFDDIVTVFDPVPGGNYSCEFLVCIRRWASVWDGKLSETYIAGGTRYDAFCRSVCGDKVADNQASSCLSVDVVPVHPPYRKMDSYSGIFRLERRAGPGVCQVFQKWWSESGTYDYKPQRKEQDIEVIVRRNCAGKRMFLTKRGYIGIGHSVVQPGDHVAVLLGGEKPFVVRPVQPGGSRTEYTYHGPCYVHGIMDGEAVEQLNLLPRPYPFVTLV